MATPVTAPSWRDAILREFTPQVARLTLVADPDGLLLEEGVLKGIEERGFELIPFQDPVAFRYAYESRYRSRWDRGEVTDLVVVLRSPASDLRALPYDLLQAGRALSFSLADLFPNLSLRIVEALDRSDLDALYEAQVRERLDHPLGDNQTSSFVLRHVFKVAPETIRDPARLLKFLLERHYRGLKIPRVLDDYLIGVVRTSGLFEDWPLEVIVPDREAFLVFLQERWPIFLDRMVSEGEEPAPSEPAEPQMREDPRPYNLEMSGPIDLPFDHHDVRVYVDNLFLEGLLRPVAHPGAGALAATWAGVGVRVDGTDEGPRRWVGLLETVEESLPGREARHQEWQAFALRWAQLVALRYGIEGGLGGEEVRRFEELRQRVDGTFLGWVRERFGTLHNLPPLPPVMVHHLPRLLARRLDEARDARVALLVLDGLALDQWVVVQEVLRYQRPALRFREEAVFAWIPTLTSVSRQACFAGRPPLYFPATLRTTEAEAKLWSRFWEDEGLAPDEVGYEKGIRDLTDLERVDEWTSKPRLRAVGLVVDQVDRIMHGMQLGTAGMQNQVRQWAEQGLLAGLFDLLLERGFAVFLTADHGNVEASGLGRPSEGALAELRGERVRVFDDAVLRARVHERFPHAIPWPPVGLPDDCLALMAPWRCAFVPEAKRIVAHGGITVEEVMVPLVCIERKGARP